MKFSVKLISLLCVLAMLISLFAACANTDDPEDTDPSATTVDPNSTEPVDPDAGKYDKDGYWKDDLAEDLKFDDTVTIFYWKDVERTEFDVLEEETGVDIVTDAVYNRNLAVQDRLGVTFEWIGQNGNVNNIGSFTTAVGNAFSGGTYYDIIATYSRTAATCLTGGYLQDLNQIEDSYLNLDQPWWPQTMKDTCTIGDSLFFVSGDISTNVLHFMYAVYYNMNMLDNLQMEDPIELVDNHQWTIDKLIEMSNGLYNDLDQDGSPSIGDVYGFVSDDFHLDAFYTGSGFRLVEGTGDSGAPLMISEDFFGQVTVDLVDKLGKWFEQGSAYANASFDYDEPFLQGNALFCLNRVYMADTYYNGGAGLRFVDWEYGILPVPLHDESQPEYLTLLGNPITLWCVMQNATNPSMSSAVIECMGSEGYRKTSPALFENNMKYRYAPDTEGKGDSARMFDIIRENINFDLGRIFSQSLSFMSELPSKAAAASSSWASMKAQLSRALSKQMNTLNKDLAEVIG